MFIMLISSSCTSSGSSNVILIMWTAAHSPETCPPKADSLHGTVLPLTQIWMELGTAQAH